MERQFIGESRPVPRRALRIASTLSLRFGLLAAVSGSTRCNSYPRTGVPKLAQAVADFSVHATLGESW